MYKLLTYEYHAYTIEHFMTTIIMHKHVAGKYFLSGLLHFNPYKPNMIIHRFYEGGGQLCSSRHHIAIANQLHNSFFFTSNKKPCVYLHF